jgi:hypothetical protein
MVGKAAAARPENAKKIFRNVAKKWRKFARYSE